MRTLMRIVGIALCTVLEWAAPRIPICSADTNPTADRRISNEGPGVTFKIQLGPQLPGGHAGIYDSQDPLGKTVSPKPLASVVALVRDHGNLALGLGLDIEGNEIEMGPPHVTEGHHSFGIAVIRPMLMAEWRPGAPGEHRLTDTQPYATLGAGWNFPEVGTRIKYPLGAPPGTPTDLHLSGSPALRLGVGLHRRVNARNLFLHGEVGWKWVAGDYRLTIQGSPDRTGTFDVSGWALLAGLTLPI